MSKGKPSILTYPIIPKILNVIKMVFVSKSGNITDLYANLEKFKYFKSNN